MTDIEYLRLQVDGAIPTLRDQFAMAALTGYLAYPSSNATFEGFASDAYKQADAMLAQRDKH